MLHLFSVCFVQDEGRDGRRLPHEAALEAERAAKVNERMPTFVGICVLIAITFVLSRSPQQQQAVAGQPSHYAAGVSSVSAATVPEGTKVVATNDVVSPPDNNGPVIQISPPASTVSMTSSSSMSSSAASQSSVSCDCDGKIDPKDIDMGALRAAALASTPPHIIECSAATDGESQSACHLPPQTRFAALGQKGATLWMTGCSGAGKTTIATALEDRLVKTYGKHVYRLDGDNLRTGINRDLSFSEADRAESVRRTGEIATLFADAGVITLVGLISPSRGDGIWSVNDMKSRGYHSMKYSWMYPLMNLRSVIRRGSMPVWRVES